MHTIIQQLNIRVRDVLTLKGLSKIRSLETQVLALSQIPALDLPGWVKASLVLEQEGPGLWRHVYRACKPALLATISISVGCSLAASISSLIGVQILRQGSGASLSVGFFLALFFFFCTLVNQYGVYLSARSRNFATIAVEGSLSHLIAVKLLKLSPHTTDPEITTGNLKVLLTSDVKAINALLESSLRNLVPTVIALAILCPVIIFYAGKPGAAAVALLFMLLPFSWLLNHAAVWFQARALTRLDALASLCGDWIKNARIIRMLGLEETLEQQLLRRLKSYMKFAVGLHWTACFTWSASVSWWMLSITGMAYLTDLWGVKTAADSFWGAVWLITFLAGFLTHVPGVLRSYAEAMPAAKRIQRLLTQPELLDQLMASREIQDHPASPVDARHLLKVHLESVSLKINSTLVLDDITLIWDLSKKIAVVGEVGSGKSLLMALITGEIKPTSGRVMVEWSDGTRTDFWSTGAYTKLRERLSLVQQEVYVSSGSLIHNLTLEGDQNADVMKSLEWAALSADISQLPQKMNTVIGERGLNLSGGQRSRLALARAHHQLTHDRTTLVLDDVLSALDTSLEQTIFSQLQAHSGGVLLVTHRVSLLLGLDQVWVMAQGRIVEQGHPRALFDDEHSLFKKVMTAYQAEEGKEKYQEASPRHDS